MMVAAPGVHNVQRPAFAAGASGNVGITYYASGDPSAQMLSAYITQTRDALAAQPLFYSGAINDPAHPIFHDYGLTGGSPRLDFVGGAYDSPGTAFWAGVVKQTSPPDASHNNDIPTTGYAGRLSFDYWASAPGAATPAAGTTPRCAPSARLVFRINRVPGGRVVRAVAYVNGRRVLTRRGRNVRRIAFARPAGPRLRIRIVTVNNRGGRVVTLRTFRGCTRTRVVGRVHRHRHARRRRP
jgi:hypothetical protein